MTSTIKVDTIQDSGGNTIISSDGSGTITQTASIGSFSSTGIDDNASSTAITINSSNLVGIGTTSPNRILDIRNDTTSRHELSVNNSNVTGSSGLEIISNSNQLEFYVFSSNGNGWIRNDKSLTIRTEDASTYLALGAGATEAMRIDDSGNILFGSTLTASTNYGAKFLKDGSTSEILAIHRQAADGDLIQFARGGNDVGKINYDSGYLNINGQVNGLTISSGGSEAMRIDSSGRLLVGKTTANTTDLGNTVYAGIVSASMSGDPAIFANRSQDGSIIELQQSGTTVGNIGVNSDRLYIGDSTYGTIAFANGYNAVFPAGSGGSPSDNTHDLGSASTRWQDLYLSGSVYLGGTGSANALDDYEEGSWTPAYTGTSGYFNHSEQTGRYTKIGRKVFVTGRLQGNRSTVSGNITISGLPFSADVVSGGSGAGMTIGFARNFATDLPNLKAYISTTTFTFRTQATNGTTSVSLGASDLSTSTNSNYLYFSGTYETTA